jgi:RNA polymerase primary sigma factor
VPASSSQSWWLESIGRVPLLTPAEEIELGTAIQRWQQHPDPCPPGIRRRGIRARDRFVSANLRLVVDYVAKRCHRLAKAFDREDLIQAGNMALITAAERFDPTRGYRFSTYGYWWIRQGVNSWVDRHGRSIAIPGSHCQHLAKLGPITQRLERELGRLPTQAEIATELGVSLKVLAAVRENGRGIGSLDQVVTDDGLELGSTVAVWDRSLEDEDDERERWRQAEQLRGLIARLPPQDQRLLCMAWGLDGVEIPRAELAQQEGLSTRALEVRLERLQASLAAESVQLVLVAVAREKVELKKWPRRKRERPDQLVLVPVERVKPQPVVLRRCGSNLRNWLALRERLQLVVSGGSW